MWCSIIVSVVTTVTTKCHIVFVPRDPVFSSVNKELPVGSFCLIGARGFMSSRGRESKINIFVLFFACFHYTVIV